jgi:septin family protein
MNSQPSSHAFTHVQDIRYAEKATPSIPHRVQKQQLKILVTGQPETGRTTAIKNLFASIVGDPEWSPTDVAGLTMEDFRATPERFTTTVIDRGDTGGHLSISYIIQVRSQLPRKNARLNFAPEVWTVAEWVLRTKKFSLTERRHLQETPGIKCEPKVAAEALANYMRAEQEAYADQEAKLNMPRGELVDGRVDCVLYFLPTNARIGESDLDFTVINALAAYAPVIPLMCKVRAAATASCASTLLLVQ